MAPKKKIIICDDQQKFIDAFKKNHGDDYHISHVSSISKLLNTIEVEKPDLILLDLFHPKDNKADFDVRRKKAEVELSRLNDQIQITKKAVDETWIPLGLELLKDIRLKYSSRKLPVIIYSQRGLFLLTDEQIRSVEENDGHWMLKDTFSPLTEKTRMDRILEYAGKAKPLIKLYRTLLIISCVVILFLISYKILSLEMLWNFIISILGGIITFFISKLIEK